MLRQKLLIHIGMGKTGSTSIQRTLFRAADWLSERGISYPVMGKAPQHNRVQSIYLPYDRTARRLKSKLTRTDYVALGKQYRTKLLEALGRCDNAILSAESFFGFWDEDIEKFHQDIRDLGWRDVQVIAYVREPSSHYLSSVQQRIKGSASVPSPVTWYYDSHANLNRWRNRFPVSASVFDRKALVRQCVVSDFLQHASDFFGIPLRVEEVAIENKNESLSAEGMIVIQRYRKLFFQGADNRMMPASDLLVRILEESAAVFPQTKPLLKQELAAHIVHTHAPVIKNLEHEYGIKFDLQKDVAAEPSAQAREYNVEDLVERYDAEIVERLLWHALHRSLGEATAVRG